MASREFLKFKTEKEPIKETGKDVSINVSVIRHGEKTKKGELSFLGSLKAMTNGIRKEIPEQGLKAYVSPFDRTKKTVEAILKGIRLKAKKHKTFKTRVRLELAPPEWEHFDVLAKGCKEAVAKQGQGGLFKYVLSEPLAQKDLEKWTSGLAYMIDSYTRMTDKLYSHSNIELMHVTHDIVIGDFLRKVAILKDEKGERVNLDNLDAVGGSIKPLEGFNFKIYSDKEGKKDIKILFRHKELGIDKERLQELADKYKQEPYKGRTTSQDYKTRTE